MVWCMCQCMCGDFIVVVDNSTSPITCHMTHLYKGHIDEVVTHSNSDTGDGESART